MNRIISRMQKIASENISITKEVKKLSKHDLDKIADAIAKSAKAYAENEAEESYDVLDIESLEEKFFESLEDNDLIEYVQDYLENITDKQLKNISEEDLDSLKDLLFEISQIKVCEAIDDVLGDVDDQDLYDNNEPYGPGMDMHDFVDLKRGR